MTDMEAVAATLLVRILKYYLRELFPICVLKEMRYLTDIFYLAFVYGKTIVKYVLAIMSIHLTSIYIYCSFSKIMA